jgi:hypothetical protein
MSPQLFPSSVTVASYEPELLQPMGRKRARQLRENRCVLKMYEPVSLTHNLLFLFVYGKVLWACKAS